VLHPGEWIELVALGRGECDSLGHETHND
jgi:hypothetical protein